MLMTLRSQRSVTFKFKETPGGANETADMNDDKCVVYHRLVLKRCYNGVVGATLRTLLWQRFVYMKRLILIRGHHWPLHYIAQFSLRKRFPFA